MLCLSVPCTASCMSNIFEPINHKLETNPWRSQSIHGVLSTLFSTFVWACVISHLVGCHLAHPSRLNTFFTLHSPCTSSHFSHMHSPCTFLAFLTLHISHISHLVHPSRLNTFKMTKSGYFLCVRLSLQFQCLGNTIAQNLHVWYVCKRHFTIVIHT